MLKVGEEGRVKPGLESNLVSLCCYHPWEMRYLRSGDTIKISAYREKPSPPHYDYETAHYGVVSIPVDLIEPVGAKKCRLLDHAGVTCVRHQDEGRWCKPGDVIANFGFTGSDGNKEVYWRDFYGVIQILPVSDVVVE